MRRSLPNPKRSAKCTRRSSQRLSRQRPSDVFLEYVTNYPPPWRVFSFGILPTRIAPIAKPVAGLPKRKSNGKDFCPLGRTLTRSRINPSADIKLNERGSLPRFVDALRASRRPPAIMFRSAALLDQRH